MTSMRIAMTIALAGGLSMLACPKGNVAECRVFVDRLMQMSQNLMIGQFDVASSFPGTFPENAKELSNFLECAGFQFSPVSNEASEVLEAMRVLEEGTSNLGSQFSDASIILLRFRLSGQQAVLAGAEIVKSRL